MKNLLNFSIMATTVLVLVACQKQSISPDRTEISGQSASKGKPEITRIKTSTEAGVIKTFTYDANGRSLGYTTSNGSSLSYQYPDANHVIETPPFGPVVNYELNSKGLAIKSTAIGNTYQTTYTYNPKKQIIQWYSADGTNVALINYSYLNGNLDNDNAFSNGNQVRNRTYTYYETPNVLDHDVYGESFRGVGSKNLLKSVTDESDGDLTVMNFTYVFDNLGRVIKMSRTQNGAVVPDVTFTYY